jgi:hypothetical protein
MARLIWILPVLLLAACGHGKPSTTLTVTCTKGTELVGATSIDVLGDVTDGRPTMTYPDPVHSGQTGTISVRPRGHCTIVPVGG